MDAALTQAWDIGSISFQIALLFVYLLQIRLCTGMAGEKESIDKIIAEHSAGSLSYKDAGTTSQNNSAITIDSLPNALGIVKKDAYHQMAGEHARNAPLDKSEFSLHGKWNRTVRNSFSGEGGGNKKEIANCAPRVLASKNEASVPPGKEFAISIPNIQKELGIVKKGVNRKKAINEILQRSPNWPIPEEKVDNLLSAPNVANEEDLVKLKSENPTYHQTAADKDLVAYHNVSTGKLREAIKLGGLPMPYLAITKRDIP